MRTGISLLLAALCLAAAPALAGATPPVSVPVPAEPDALAFAPGHVLWATHTLHGPVVLKQAPSMGGPATVLATIPRVHPATGDVAVTIAATAHGYMLTARDGRLITTGECGCDYDVSQGELVVRGGYDGSVTNVVHCVPKPDDTEEPDLQVVAGTDAYALAGARCGTTAAVETIAADGAVAPVSGITLVQFSELSFAAPFVAVTGTAAGAPKMTSVHIFDTAHGTRRDLPYATTTSGGPFQVLSDGTLVLGSGGYAGVTTNIYVWSPGEAAPHLLPGGLVKPAFGAAGAGRVMLSPGTPLGGQTGALGLIGLDGTGLRPVGAPGAGISRQPLYLDATTAAFRSNSCAGRAQVTVVDLADTTPASAPFGCPVQIRSTAVKFDRQGRGSIQVLCPNGCRGAFQLYIALTPKQISTHELNRYVDKVLDSHLADAKLTLAASPTPQRVRLKMVKPAIALMRRHRRLRVFPSVGYSGDIGVGPELTSPVRSLTARR